MGGGEGCLILGFFSCSLFFDGCVSLSCPFEQYDYVCFTGGTVPESIVFIRRLSVSLFIGTDQTRGLQGDVVYTS